MRPLGILLPWYGLRHSTDETFSVKKSKMTSVIKKKTDVINGCGDLMVIFWTVGTVAWTLNSHWQSGQWGYGGNQHTPPYSPSDFYRFCAPSSSSPPLLVLQLISES